MMFKTFVQDDSGATAIEYGLIAALIAMSLIGTITTLMEKQRENYNLLSECIERSSAANC